MAMVDFGSNRILRVGVTGTGAVASAYIRALVPAGYDVRTFGLGSQRVMAHTALSPDLTDKLTDKFDFTEQVLRGNRYTNPFRDLSRFEIAAPHRTLDLSLAESWSPNPFACLDAVILTAANPDPNQSPESATRNNTIDRYSIDNAIAAGVKVIIYTSSVWRTMQKLRDGSTDLIDPMKDRAPPPESHYAEMKARSVDYLREKAKKNPGFFFIFNDHGWYPRETMGDPIRNTEGNFMQLWVAEAEMQLYILKQLESGAWYLHCYSHDLLHGNAGPNIRGFNVVSFNDSGGSRRYKFPPDMQVQPFTFDLSESRKLKAVCGYNVFDVIYCHDSSWRRIPVIGK